MKLACILPGFILQEGFSLDHSIISALCDEGHSIALFCQCEFPTPTYYKGVEYHDMAALPELTDSKIFDAVIVWEQSIALPSFPGLKIFACTDTFDLQAFNRNLYQYDRVVFFDDRAYKYCHEKFPGISSISLTVDRASSLVSMIKDYPPKDSPSLSICMIVQDEEKNLVRCLDSLGDDLFKDNVELIIVDTGSDDHTVETAKRYTNKILPYETQQESFDFSKARNFGIEQATKDWIMWLDGDEMVINFEHIWKYLEGEYYDAFLIKRRELSIDEAPLREERLVKIFRNSNEYQFYGMVHESPMFSLNTPIAPSMVIPDMTIVHFGYLTERDREKAFKRNFALLEKDKTVYPGRDLTIILSIKAHVNLAKHQALSGGPVEKVFAPLREAYELYSNFSFEGHALRLQRNAFNYVQEALSLLAELGVGVTPSDGPPINIVLGLAGARGKLSQPPGGYPLRSFYFANEEECKEFLINKIDELLNMVS